MSAPIPHVIRPMGQADRAFVVETTLKVRQPRGLSWREWEGLRRSETERIADDGTVLVVEADGVLLGYATAHASDHGPVLGMLYVKRDFRGDGLGMLLLAALGMNAPVLVDHPTASWRAWARRRQLPWASQREREAA